MSSHDWFHENWLFLHRMHFIFATLITLSGFTSIQAGEWWNFDVSCVNLFCCTSNVQKTMEKPCRVNVVDTSPICWLHVMWRIFSGLQHLHNRSHMWYVYCEKTGYIVMKSLVYMLSVRTTHWPNLSFRCWHSLSSLIVLSITHVCLGSKALKRESNISRQMRCILERAWVSCMGVFVLYRQLNISQVSAAKRLTVSACMWYVSTIHAPAANSVVPANTTAVPCTVSAHTLTALPGYLLYASSSL